MNKYDYLFNEYMTELEASSVMFREVDKLTSKEEKDELLKAWSENDKKISKREHKEYGDDVLTQAIM